VTVKKFIAFLLTLALVGSLSLNLTGCNKGGTTKKESPGDSPAKTKTS
jgi:hypothetical protein